MITAYYLCHGHWTVIPHQLEADFRDMVDCGFTAVAMSFSESEMTYSRRAFELQLRLAHRCGLKCLVIPSRLGGRFAGAPLMPSMWLAMNPQCRVPNYDGWPIACLESPAFVDWVRQFMTKLVGDYELDGIIWDEPKGLDVVSRHPDTLARYGDEPTLEQVHEGHVAFLADLTAQCLSIRPDLSITLFSQKTDPASFTQRAAGIEGIEYIGYDGNLAQQSFFHEPPQWCKYRIESVWERTVAEAKAAGKKTFALVENMLMPAAAMAEYERNLQAYLRDYHPDHLSIYYYAHNNEDPEQVHQITRSLMRRCLRR